MFVFLRALCDFVVKKIYHEGTKDTKSILATNSDQVRLRRTVLYRLTNMLWSDLR